MTSMAGYSTKIVRMGSGERFPLMVSRATGLPDAMVCSYSVSQHRKGSINSSKREVDTLCLLQEWLDKHEADLPVDLLEHLEPAWAITTHKAQGSQFGTVIVPVTSSRILDRTLIYTALTRGTRRVVLVGDPAVIREAIGRPPQSSRRSTWLAQAVASAISKLEMMAA